MKSFFIKQSQGKRRWGSLGLMLPTVTLACGLTATPWLFAASTEEPSHEGHATAVAMPGWTQQLKGQTVVENAIEGRAGNAEQMEMQHHRLMQKLEQQAQEDAKAQQTSGATMATSNTAIPAPGTLARTRRLLLAALRLWELKRRIRD